MHSALRQSRARLTAASSGVEREQIQALVSNLEGLTKEIEGRG